MTTLAQVKQAVQPLLRRNPDLALVGRALVVKPVRHILRRIYIDRSIDPLIFTPKWAATFLFEPNAYLSLNWGGRLYNRSHGRWDVTNPATSRVMCEEIEREALPLLWPIQTIDDFVKFVSSKERFRDTYLDFDTPLGYELRKVYLFVARGDLEHARSICEFLATDRAKRRHLPMMAEEYDLITKRLCPLLAANDRPGLARLLHEVEAASVKKAKLDKLWEPTPFPLEMRLNEAR